VRKEQLEKKNEQVVRYPFASLEYSSHRSFLSPREIEKEKFFMELRIIVLVVIFIREETETEGNK